MTCSFDKIIASEDQYNWSEKWSDRSENQNDETGNIKNLWVEYLKEETIINWIWKCEKLNEETDRLLRAIETWGLNSYICKSTLKL